MALFIGGTHDGERIEVREDVEHIELPMGQVLRSVHADGIDFIADSHSMRVESYIQQRLAGNTAEGPRRFIVFALYNMTGGEVVARLIEGYKRK